MANGVRHSLKISSGPVCATLAVRNAGVVFKPGLLPESLTSYFRNQPRQSVFQQVWDRFQGFSAQRATDEAMLPLVPTCWTRRCALATQENMENSGTPYGLCLVLVIHLCRQKQVIARNTAKYPGEIRESGDPRRQDAPRIASVIAASACHPFIPSQHPLSSLHAWSQPSPAKKSSEHQCARISFTDVAEHPFQFPSLLLQATLKHFEEKVLLGVNARLGSKYLPLAGKSFLRQHRCIWDRRSPKASALSPRVREQERFSRVAREIASGTVAKNETDTA